MQLSDAFANKVLDWILGSQNNGVGDVQVRLLTAAPNLDGTYTEVQGGGYAPTTVPNDDTHWVQATNRQKSNAQAIDCGTVTGSAWNAPATHFAVTQADGLLISGGALADPLPGNVGDSIVFQVGGLVASSPSTLSTSN